MSVLSLFAETGYRSAMPDEVNPLLASHHYLGPRNRGMAFAQFDRGEVVACMVWGKPTSRRLPQDGTWLELARWCLTPAAGQNAGSRMHRAFVRHLRAGRQGVTTLVSYSDPAAGHTGALYRACNWQWAPTWHRLRPPPSGLGSWSDGKRQDVKDRWVFILRPDDRRGELLKVNDEAVNPGLMPWRPGLRWAS